MVPSQHTELTHLDHCIHKLLKEQVLVNGKAGDDPLSLLIIIQILVGGEQTLSIHQVNVVLVVELVGCTNVKDGGVVGGGCRARDFKGVSEALVDVGGLSGVEAVGEGGAVAATDGVAAREGDDVGGVEVFGGKGGEDGVGVAERGGEVV